MKKTAKLIFILTLITLFATLLCFCSPQKDDSPPNTENNRKPTSDDNTQEDEIIQCKGYTLTVCGTVLKDISFTNHGTAVRVVIPEGITEVAPNAGVMLLTAVSLTIPSTLEKYEYVVDQDNFGKITFINQVPKLTEIYDLSPHFDFALQNALYSKRLNYNLKVIHKSLDEPSILEEKDGFMFYRTDKETVLVGMTEPKTDLIVPAYHDDKTKYTFAMFAFANCNFIKNVTLSEGITTLSTCCFASCYKLEQINFPSTIKTINQESFTNSYSLTKLDFPEGLERIEAYAFKSSNVTKIIFPDSLSYIGDSAFEYCNPKDPEIIWNYTSDWIATASYGEKITLTQEDFDDPQKLTLKYVFDSPFTYILEKSTSEKNTEN